MQIQHCSQFLHIRQTIPAMLSSNYIASTHNIYTLHAHYTPSNTLPTAFHNPAIYAHKHGHLQSCVGTQARLSDVQLRKAYFVKTLYAIRVCACACYMLVTACLRVRSSWYEYPWFEISQAMPGYARACRHLCTQLTNTKHNWQNGTRCRDGVNELWCHSYLVWPVFEGSIPTCA